MRTTPPNKTQRPWGKAILGSAAVSLAIAVAVWNVADPAEATIVIIAILTIVALALWSARRRDPCR